MGWNFEIIERNSDIHVPESKLMSYPQKNLKFEASLSRNLTASLCTDVRKKQKIANNIWKSWDCWKVMVSCGDSVEKIDSVSDKWQRTLLTNRRIFEVVSERCRASGRIYSRNDSRRGFWLRNFLHGHLTTKYVSCEIWVNFWVRYNFFWHSFKINVFSSNLSFKRMK